MRVALWNGMKNPPKPEMETSREAVICRGEKNDSAGFAVVLFTMPEDSHEAIRFVFPILCALRVCAGFGQRRLAVRRGKNAQVSYARMRVSSGLRGGRPAGASGESRRASGDFKKRLFDLPACEASVRFPPAGILSPG